MNAATQCRLLIVDDEVAQMKALCNTLEMEGYSTTGYSSPRQALASLRAGEVDLLLTDLDLPGMGLFSVTLVCLLLFLMNPGGGDWYLLVLVVAAAAGFGLAMALAALAPNLAFELIALALAGAASIAFMSTGNSTLQLASDPSMRGRVMALYVLVFLVAAGLVGYFTKVHSIPSLGLVLGAAAIIGGIMGSYLGSRRLAVRAISLFLATVLLIAGMKLLFTR